MKFTLSWLKTHLETNASLDEIVYNLTDLGLEVEEVLDPLKKIELFTIGYISKSKKHPEADKLKVCEVETDEGNLSIICGAPNARKGIYVVVAKPGMYVPGIDTTIGVGKIRGIESHGMMCSEREMGLSNEHDGIIELEGKPLVGSKFIDHLIETNPSTVDPIIEIAITPNRPDALGVRGIARDLAARGLGVLKPLKTTMIKGKNKSNIKISIDKEVLEKGCPVFYSCEIRGVKNGPSPKWLKDRIESVGLRSISSLVDITNFFTIDRARPLHVFDADKISGNLRISFADGNENIDALDEKKYNLPKGAMKISDHSNVISIAGIMGGSSTGCSEETTNVLLESAYWDPITIAKAGRSMKINSDARYRFERGVDPDFTKDGIMLGAKMIMDLCGGTAHEIIKTGEIPSFQRTYTLNSDKVQSLVGMKISQKKQISILKSLGFKIVGNTASPPPWRPDIQGEADLVEEIARVTSLTKLEGIPLPIQESSTLKNTLTPFQKREATIRREIAALGYNECVTYSFISEKTALLFGGGSNDTKLENPISTEMTHMRPSLLPGLLQAASRNQSRGIFDMALFEIGPVFHGGEPENQEILATGILVGHTNSRDVHNERRKFDPFDIKADVQKVLESIGCPTKLMIIRDVNKWWHPGRSGKLSLGPKNNLAGFGEVHPKVLSELNIKGPVMAFAIHIEKPPFPRVKTNTRSALKISDYQAVQRDFSFIVDRHIEASTLVNAAKSADKTLIKDAYVFDHFINQENEETNNITKKSLAITVQIQSSEKTLVDEEIEIISQKIIKNIEKASGGILRN